MIYRCERAAREKSVPSISILGALGLFFAVLVNLDVIGPNSCDIYTNVMDFERHLFTPKEYKSSCSNFSSVAIFFIQFL